MKLHEDSATFREVIQATAGDLNIRDVYVEKDYWITFLLWRLSNLKNSKKFVFKGGTSLSKAYHLIERFSEDVDLAITEIEDLNGNQIKKLIDQASKALTTQPLQDDKENPKTSKGSRFRRTVHQYPRLGFDSKFSGASSNLLLEINSFANPEPAELCTVQSYTGQFLGKKFPQDVSKYSLEPFKIKVLALERTYVEKLLSLIRHSHQGADALREKIRHLYDIAKLDSTAPIRQVQTNPLRATEIIEKVKECDRTTEDFAGPWLEMKFSDAPLFHDPRLKHEMKKAYMAVEFQSLIWDKTRAPTFDESWAALLRAQTIFK